MASPVAQLVRALKISLLIILWESDFVAQLVEHLTFNEGVPGSSPGGVTIINHGSSWDSAGGVEPPFTGSLRFESSLFP